MHKSFYKHKWKTPIRREQIGWPKASQICEFVLNSHVLSTFATWHVTNVILHHVLIQNESFTFYLLQGNFEETNYLYSLCDNNLGTNFTILKKKAEMLHLILTKSREESKSGRNVAGRNVAGRNVIRETVFREKCLLCWEPNSNEETF